MAARSTNQGRMPQLVAGVGWGQTKRMENGMRGLALFTQPKQERQKLLEEYQRQHYRKIIQDKVAQKEYLSSEINHLAKEAIPDFHFLDYRVSEFWTCDQSPIGMCLFILDYDNGHPYKHYMTECRYCGGPTERK